MEAYDRIFVEIWEKGKATKIKRFSQPLDAWCWVVENNIENYTVSKGLCVVDKSG